MDHSMLGRPLRAVPRGSQRYAYRVARIEAGCTKDQAGLGFIGIISWR
jgi:hypothetical protein